MSQDLSLASGKLRLLYTEGSGLSLYRIEPHILAYITWFCFSLEDRKLSFFCLLFLLRMLLLARVTLHSQQSCSENAIMDVGFQRCERIKMLLEWFWTSVDLGIDCLPHTPEYPSTSPWEKLNFLNWYLEEFSAYTIRRREFFGKCWTLYFPLFYYKCFQMCKNLK